MPAGDSRLPLPIVYDHDAAKKCRARGEGLVSMMCPIRSSQFGADWEESSGMGSSLELVQRNSHVAPHTPVLAALPLDTRCGGARPSSDYAGGSLAGERILERSSEMSGCSCMTTWWR